MKTLFAGLSIIDIQMFVGAYPKPNTKTRTDKFEISTGGPATNAAITCAFLGSDVTLVSPVGKHYFTYSLKESILKHNVKIIDPINESESEPLIASIITDESNGERTIFSFNPSVKSIDFNPDLYFDISEFSLALFDGFYSELSICLLEKLRMHNIPCILDGGSWKPGLQNILPYIDIAICSNDFFPPGTIDQFEVIAYLESCGIKKIAITRGDKPILFTENGKIKEIEVRKVKCKDSLGAGDIIHGAFCYFYSIGISFEESLSRAADIASFSCMHRGTRSWMNHYKKIKQTENEEY